MDINLNKDQKRLYVTFGAIFIIILILIVLNLNILGEGEKYKTNSGTANINKEDNMITYIDFVSGDSKNIKYSVNVVEGPNIDVFLMDEKNFNRYSENERFNYLKGSTINVTDYQGNATLKEHGKYYLVFDNGNDIYHAPDIGKKFSTAKVEWKVSVENNDTFF